MADNLVLCRAFVGVLASNAGNDANFHFCFGAWFMGMSAGGGSDAGRVWAGPGSTLHAPPFPAVQRHWRGGKVLCNNCCRCCSCFWLSPHLVLRLLPVVLLPPEAMTAGFGVAGAAAVNFVVVKAVALPLLLWHLPPLPVRSSLCLPP